MAKDAPCFYDSKNWKTRITKHDKVSFGRNKVHSNFGQFEKLTEPSRARGELGKRFIFIEWGNL